jgi:hypothetical protein
VDGVTPEVPQEVGVLLEHHDRQTLAEQQDRQHHPGGAAPDDADVALVGHDPFLADGDG